MSDKVRDFDADFKAALAAEADAYKVDGRADRVADCAAEQGTRRSKKETAVADGSDLERAVDTDEAPKRTTRAKAAAPADDADAASDGAE